MHPIFWVSIGAVLAISISMVVAGLWMLFLADRPPGKRNPR